MTKDPPTILEIRDPALDGEGIIQEVYRRVAQRQAEGAYGPDPATMGPAELYPGRYDLSADTAPPDFPGLRLSLAELIARGHLAEPGFSSDIPIVGTLIVAVRRLWNWMSTKWYVRPLLWQQSDVNARTARVVSDLAQWQELGAKRINQLEAQVTELEARLAQLEAGSEQ